MFLMSVLYVLYLQVLQEDLLELLGKAVTCAILGKSGQQRSRVLALLVKVRQHLSLSTTSCTALLFVPYCADVRNIYRTVG